MVNYQDMIDRKQCGHKIPTTFNNDGKIILNAKDVSNLFNDYFTCIGENMANSMPSVHGYENYLTETGIKNGFTLYTLLREEVKSINKNQKPKISCGIDDTNNRIVKECYKELSKPIMIIINKPIESTKVPKLYKKLESSHFIRKEKPMKVAITDQ